MSESTLPFRTGQIHIDATKCKDCRSYACVKACSLFGTNILRIEDGVPSPIPTLEDMPRRCNECLACEIYCQQYGNCGIDIALPIQGLCEAVNSNSESCGN